jgi:class 3 adenylate cyclase
MKDFFMVFLIPFLGGLVLYILGFIVFILKPNTRASWVFFLLCFGLGTYMVTGFEMQSTYYFVHIHFLVIPFFPATFFHLGLIFPERKRFLKRFPSFEYMVYLPALIIAFGYQLHLFTFSQALKAESFLWVPGLMEVATFNRIFTLICVASLLGFVFHSTFKASSILARQRARMILFGVSIAFVPSVLITVAVFFFKFSFPWNFLVFFVIFFPASIAYSIVKHNLFDSDVIIKRTAGYSIVTIVVIGAYVGVSVVLNVVAGKYQLAQSQMFPILFTLCVILVFNPLHSRIQALVDRIFFRKEYDYGEIVEKIGRAMTSLLEMPQILRHLVNTFMEDMFVSTSSVVLLNPASSEYEVRLAEGEGKQRVGKKVIKRNNPLMKIIESERKELTKYDVLEDPKYQEISENCVSDFESLNSTLIVPLVFQEKVIGSLNLGEKKSGKSYNREDVELLRNIANQGALAIEIARSFENIKRLNQDLKEKNIELANALDELTQAMRKVEILESIKANLTKFVPTTVTKMIEKSPESQSFDATERDLSVMFLDIEGYTKITEEVGGTEVNTLVEKYFSVFMDAIYANNGDVVETSGDGLMVLFLSDEETTNALDATRTAIDILERTSIINRERPPLSKPLAINIGISSGDAFVGATKLESLTGSRWTYTSHGSVVNLAARICGKAKGGELLVSRETSDRVKDHYQTSLLGNFSLKNVSEEIEIFSVHDLKIEKP